jgi:hypothetical protein
MTKPIPLAWRVLLVAAFHRCAAAGYGRVEQRSDGNSYFEAYPGQEDAAADFLEARADPAGRAMTTHCRECLIEVPPSARTGCCEQCRPVRRHSRPQRNAQAAFEQVVAEHNNRRREGGS